MLLPQIVDCMPWGVGWMYLEGNKNRFGINRAEEINEVNHVIVGQCVIIYENLIDQALHIP
jgi:hypothetical protein